MEIGRVRRDRFHILKRAYRLLTRADVAAVLILVLLLLALLGSCFPQISPTIAADGEREAQWEAGLRAKYGGLADLLAAGGLFRLFRSPAFLVSVSMLGIATLVCTLDRWRGLWRRTLHLRVRCSDAALDAAPHAASVSASAEVDIACIVCEALERRSFRVRSESDAGITHMRGDRNWLTSLATLLTHLALVLLLVGVGVSGRWAWQETVTIGPGETAGVGHGTGLLVRNDRFAVEHYADGSVSGFQAEITVFGADGDVSRGSVRVNEPLTRNGVAFLLHSYEGVEDRYAVTLLAVHDPGFGLVIVAGFLLLFGMTVSFNFPHCWVHARIEPGGMVRLAGRADRRAWDYGREFAALVAEIGQGPGS